MRRQVTRPEPDRAAATRAPAEVTGPLQEDARRPDCRVASGRGARYRSADVAVQAAVVQTAELTRPKSM
ncbi:hypothetical protein CC117_12305 [Parafrankia colletiae]|uniref:Uncharacterized protein n=1 Tax=Parafrankia colletiae TaxID=573497 RepID=A0A1S1R5W5_9ACTN|nr:hypothetical protein CC117_12305 [Parafrankia colletiae]